MFLKEWEAYAHHKIIILDIFCSKQSPKCSTDVSHQCITPFSHNVVCGFVYFLFVVVFSEELKLFPPAVSVTG